MRAYATGNTENRDFEQESFGFTDQVSVPPSSFIHTANRKTNSFNYTLKLVFLVEFGVISLLVTFS